MAPAAGRGVAPARRSRRSAQPLQDYRWSNNGPLVAPGKYVASLVVPPAGSASPQSSSEFEVQVDPGVLRDGMTAADLVDQQTFLVRVRDAIADATRLRAETQQAMEKADIQPARSPGPASRSTPSNTAIRCSASGRAW